MPHARPVARSRAPSRKISGASCLTETSEEIALIPQGHDRAREVRQHVFSVQSRVVREQVNGTISAINDGVLATGTEHPKATVTICRTLVRSDAPPNVLPTAYYCRVSSGCLLRS